jgi:histidinol dehydrogenase
MRWFRTSDPAFDGDFHAFLARRRGGASPEIDHAAREIVEDVRTRGAAAVVEHTLRLDRVAIDPTSLQLKGADIASAAAMASPEVRRAIDFAAARIRAFHASQLPQDRAPEGSDGVELGWRWTPIDAVGLYVPGGLAAYPSTVLMNAVPARIAGVRRLVMVSPLREPALSPAVAYAALAAGVDEFYPVGGAQAVAALAFGAGPLKAVDKIVGPGNAWVTAAKRIVFGEVGIDTIAGPSEITVVADGQNEPDWIAADLLSQAEHDRLAQSVLVTDDEAFARRVEQAAQHLLDGLGEAPTARAAWAEHAAIVVAPLSDAAAIVNRIAPEHVEIAVEDADAIARDVRHAGAIFLGRHAPEALGDYVTGSNHVLPTSGAARFASGLSVLDFMKRTSVQRISPAGFDHLAAAAETLAGAEGLPAHALSVSIRRRSA